MFGVVTSHTVFFRNKNYVSNQFTEVGTSKPSIVMDVLNAICELELLEVDCSGQHYKGIAYCMSPHNV